MRSESEDGAVPSKRSRPSGSRVSNDENETPPDAAHDGAERKQRRKQHVRAETPPLRSTRRRARAASPSASDMSQQSEEEDTSCERTRQQEQREQQQQKQAEAAGADDDAEEGLGIQRRGGTPDSEVGSEEDPLADDFVPEEARFAHHSLSAPAGSHERLSPSLMPADTQSRCHSFSSPARCRRYQPRSLSSGQRASRDNWTACGCVQHRCTCAVHILTKLTQRALMTPETL